MANSTAFDVHTASLSADLLPLPPDGSTSLHELANVSADRASAFEAETAANSHVTIILGRSRGQDEPDEAKMAVSVPSIPSRETSHRDRTEPSETDSNLARDDDSESDSSSLASALSGASLPPKNKYGLAAKRFPPLIPPAMRSMFSSHSQPSTFDQRLREIASTARRTLADTSGPESIHFSSSPIAASEADTESSATEDDELPGMWAEVNLMRERVRQRRAKIGKKRQEIRSLRRRKDEADNSFMSIIRPYLLRDGSVRQLSKDVVETGFIKMQSILEAYLIADSEYEKLETKLDDEERDLQRLEGRFFDLVLGAAYGPKHEHSSVPSDDEDRPPSRASLLGISAERHVDVHPLYRDLLDAVGERGLAVEHHTDLIRHRDAILYDLELKLKRDRVKELAGSEHESGWESMPSISEEELESLKKQVSRMSPDELKAKFKSKVRKDDIQFLREFEAEERQARRRLNSTRVEVDRLRKMCLEKSVMRKNAPYQEEYSVYWEPGEESHVQSGSMAIDLDSGVREDNSLANPEFPLLLSNPACVLHLQTPRAALREAARLSKDNPDRNWRIEDAKKEFGITTLMGQTAEENKSDFINRWLLHKLRTSPIEVEVLYSVFTSKLNITSRKLWEKDVLWFWSRDAGNTSPDRFQGAVTSNDVLGVRKSHTIGLNSEAGKEARAKSVPGDCAREKRLSAELSPRSEC